MIYYLVTSSKFEQIHKTIKMHYLSQTLFPDENEPKTQLEKFLILLIISSVTLVVLETESLLYDRFKAVFDNLELIVTVIFTLEYVARLALLKEYKGKTGFKARLSYAVSPLAICDLIAIIPYYLMFLSGDLLLLRIFRLFRMLRILKLLRGNKTIKVFLDSLIKSKAQLAISLYITLAMIFLGAVILYVVEGGIQPEAFGSIPRAMWWSMATLTTVGYGDIYPMTPLGKLLASLLAILGIGIVALPAGVIAANFNHLLAREDSENQPEINKE